MAPSYFFKYFQFKRHNIHEYDIRIKDGLVINKVKLESTKRAVFFIKGQIFLIIVYESSSSLLSLFICIFLGFFYSFFDFYILYRLFCYLFISLFYAGPMLIAVFITEMVNMLLLLLLLLLLSLLLLLLSSIIIINNLSSAEKNLCLYKLRILNDCLVVSVMYDQFNPCYSRKVRSSKNFSEHFLLCPPTITRN